MPRPIGPKDRKVVREVYSAGRAIVVELTPHGLELREKGRRRRYLLPWGAAFLDAVEREIAAERRAKAAAKREKAALRVSTAGPKGKRPRKA